VSLIHHRGKDTPIPLGKGDIGQYTAKIKKWLVDITYGNEQHPWGIVVDEQ
jgi:branched-chain amino acid aminotransferase